jgi:hypothetical protein
MSSWKDAEPAGRRREVQAQATDLEFPPDCPSPKGDGQFAAPGAPSITLEPSSTSALQEPALCPITLEPIARGIQLRGRLFELSSIVRLVLASSPPQRPALHPLYRTPLTDDEIARVFQLAIEDPECAMLLATRPASAAGRQSSSDLPGIGAPHTDVEANDDRAVGARGLLCPLGLVGMVLVVLLIAALVTGHFL